MRKIKNFLLAFAAITAILFTGCDINETLEYIDENIVVESYEDYDEAYIDDESFDDEDFDEKVGDEEDVFEDDSYDESGDYNGDADDGNVQDDLSDDENADSNVNSVTEDGEYTSKEEVALYIHLYGHLPSNFITKKEAESLGWDSSKGNLGKVAPGKSIGGDKFGNREGLLPKADGRQYYECDIDSTGGYRGAKRIVFSNDGLIFYTEDHYNSYEQLY